MASVEPTPASEARAYRLIERASEYANAARRDGDGTANARARVARHVISSAAQRAGAISARELRGSPGIRTPIEAAAVVPELASILAGRYPGLGINVFAVTRGDGLQGLAFEIALPDDEDPAIGREYFSTTERTYPGRILYRMVRMVEYCLHRHGIAPGWLSPDDLEDCEA
jgi:hypothetical protein